MAYTAGIQRPQMSNGNSNQQQNSFDRLVTVLGYKVSEKLMYAEDDKGKKYEIFVNQDSYLSGEKSISDKKLDVTGIKWMGHDINAKMESAIGVGEKVILQRSKVIKKDNGEGFARTEVNRIVGVPNPDLDKTFQGLFTMKSRVDEKKDKRLSRVMHWHVKAIDVNDDEALANLSNEINQSVSHFGKKIGKYNVTMPTMGVQFRALLKTEKKLDDGSPVYQAVESSLPFDWMKVQAEDGGQATGHPLTGDEMMALREGFIEYISSHEQFKDHLENMIIDVCVYRSYPASLNDQLRLTTGNPNRDQHADKNPLYQLSHRKSFIDMAQTEQIEGAYAVNGIIQISPNKLEKINGKAEEIPSYWVSNLHANHTKGHVFAFIRTSEGYKVEPHDNLKLINDVANRNAAQTPAQQEQRNQPQGSAPSSSQSRQEPTPAQNASLGEDEGEFDPFATEPSAPAASNAGVSSPAKNTVKFGNRK